MNWTFLISILGALAFVGGFALVLLCDYKKPFLAVVGGLLLIAGGFAAAILVVKPETVAKWQGGIFQSGATGPAAVQAETPDVSQVQWLASDPSKVTFGPAPTGAEWWIYHAQLPVPGTKVQGNEYTATNELQSPTVYLHYPDGSKPPSYPVSLVKK